MISLGVARGSGDSYSIPIQNPSFCYQVFPCCQISPFYICSVSLLCVCVCIIGWLVKIKILR